MAYDLVVKNGMVVDGSGLPRYRADVGVRHGRIVSIGRIRERGREEIDADGQVVAPGFVDGHTHMDAQIFWDPLGTSSCWHGITTVVMGNCGFTLAPCAAPDKDLVVRNLQRAEDIPAEAMAAGIDWRWTTFPEFLDCLESLPKGINYAGYIGHSALRTYVMGERAFEQPANEDDLRGMERELRDAIRAGAIGFTTSRSPSHETPDGHPVASRLATWDEVRRLVGVMGKMDAGIFELAGEGVDRTLGDPGLRDYHVRLRDLAVESGRPITFGVFSRREVPGVWRDVPGPARRDGRRRRTHVRADAQPVAERAALVQDPAALRCPAGLEGPPRAPACRATAGASRSRRCAAAWSRPPTGLRAAARSGPRPATPTTTGSSSSTPWRGRTAPWPRSRASAASTRPRR